jgi:CHASE2 domain-containing sensor protein
MNDLATWRLAVALISTAGIVTTPLLLFAAYTNRPVLRTVAEVVGGLVFAAGLAIVAALVGSPLPLLPPLIGLVGFVFVMRRQARDDTAL